MARKLDKVPSRGRGADLHAQITDAHTLSPDQLVILEEACRTADRLDQLDAIIQGKGVLELMHFRSMDGDSDDTRTVVMTVDGVLSEARQQQNILKQLLVSLRLPDAATGKKPQARGARGAYAGASKVSSIERARQRKSS
jgi:hypothetical protein